MTRSPSNPVPESGALQCRDIWSPITGIAFLGTVSGYWMAVAYSLQVNLFGLPDFFDNQGSVFTLFFTISSVDCIGGLYLQNPVVLQDFPLTYLGDTVPKTTTLI